MQSIEFLKQLYIDPATGSMLFSVLLGIFISSGYFLRLLFIKIKTCFGVKTIKQSEKHNKYLLYTDDKRYWNNFMPILDEFERRKTDVSYWTSSEDDPVFSQSYKYVHPVFIGTGNKAFIRLNAAKADVLLTTTPGLDVLQWKRSKGVKKYVHFMHAADTALTYRMFQIDFFDSILTVADYQTEEIRKIEKIRNIPPKEMKVVGLPYFDTLSKKILSAPKPDNDKKVILLAPTWGKRGYLYSFGETLISKLVVLDYEIIFRPHPQSYDADKDVLDKIRTRFQSVENFKWNSDNDNFDALNAADLLISDYSGVMFDFALVFSKPVMYTPETDFDNSIYDCAWLDETLWKYDALPKIGCEIHADDLDNIQVVIDEILSSGKYDQGIRKVREYAWMNQGHSAETIVDYLVDLQSIVSTQVEG
jgi:CDP-glycerol glycerophosphotransferase (TagB/SpsB family)